MKIRNTILLMIALSFPAQVLADNVYFGLFTDHFVSGNFNEKNNLIAYRRRNDGFDFTVGYFKNSYYRDSFVFAGDAPMKPYGDFRFGVKYGLVTGYEKGAIPFLAPWVEYKNVGVIVFGGAVMGYVTF